MIHTWGFIQASFANVVEVDAVRVAPLDGWGATYLTGARLEAWIPDGDSWKWELVATCSGEDQRLQTGGLASSAWRLSGTYKATSMFIFIGRATDQPAFESPRKVELEGTLPDWTLLVSNPYNEGVLL